MLVKRIQQSEFYRRLEVDKLDSNFFYKFGHLISCFFLAPFVIYWYFKQEYMLASIELIVLVFGCFNLRQIMFKRSDLIPRHIVLIAIGSQLLALNYYADSSASLWAYPLLATYFFILPIRQANIAAALLVIPLSIILAFNSEQIYAIRFVASISTMLLVSNLIVLINNKLQKELTNQAIIDPLTQCYNRRHIENIFKQEISLFQRSAKPTSILLIDVDYFKQVNDQFGHITGDNILRQLVHSIRDNSRASDTLFRYGGEEFVLLVPETDMQSAQLIAEKNRQLINTITLPDNNPISVSIGVCELTAGMKCDDWIKCADQALYQAKASGRNRVECYHHHAKKTSTIAK